MHLAASSSHSIGTINSLNFSIILVAFPCRVRPAFPAPKAHVDHRDCPDTGARKGTEAKLAHPDCPDSRQVPEIINSYFLVDENLNGRKIFFGK
jgi:hypothetical protein